MKRIKDIRTNTTSYGDIYILENQISGRILVGEDNCFEGIIAHYDDNFLVTGKINEEKIEMLLKNKETTKLYKVEKDGNTYYGDCFVKEDSFEYPLGECMIDIMNPEEYRTLFPGEEKILEEEIRSVKKAIKK